MEGNNEEDSTKPFEEVLDFTKPDYSFVPKGSHEWRQQGPYLICKSCELQHAVWIGVNTIMTGIASDGYPILKIK